MTTAHQTLMTMTTHWLSRFALLIAFLLAIPAYAQDEGKPNMGDTKEVAVPPEARAVDDVAMAAQLAAYGQRADDPVALIAAARILVMTGSRPLEAEVTREEGDAPADDKSAEERIALDPRALLDAARDLAGGNEAVDQMISSIEQMIPDESDARGRVLGPVRTVSRVEARATDTWTLGSFRGGEYARVVVDGDGDTDLDCWIYDENGNTIDSDTDSTDYCILSWTPSWTGTFQLRIRNWGYVWNRYVVTTN